MRTITKCRSCNGEIKEFLDLGVQFTSDFREDNSDTPAYPIVAVKCESCHLVQLRDTTPSHEMYHDNYGFKSGVSNSIKDDLEDNVQNALEFVPNPYNWLDIASNDGTLLSYVPRGVYKVGVDPITKYCAMAEEHADYVINDFFKFNLLDGAKFDVITSISCFYDMDEPNEFVSDVSKVLAKDGVWVVQQNYLLPTMELNAVDNFCHEHLEYYTLLSMEPLLERHGLEVIDLSTSMVNGGSLRTIIAHKGRKDVSPRVLQQRDIETKAKLDTMEPYTKFAESVWKSLRELKLFESDVVFAVERNPEKVGKYFNAIHVPIVSEEEAREVKPDYMIVGPWFFADEIIAREREYVANGGTLVIPLPKFEIIK